MRSLVLVLAALAMPAAAQTYQSPDNRILHNDLYALGGRITGDADTNQAALAAKLDRLHDDMTAILAQLRTAPTAAGAAPAAPVVVGLRDPCAGRADKWASLSLTPADSIKASLACAAPGFKLSLGPGRYKEAFNIPAELNGPGGVEIGGTSAAEVVLDGQGGCPVNQNGQGGGCTTRLAYGNGVIRADAQLYLHDVEVTGGGTNAGENHDGQAGVAFTGAGRNYLLRRVMVRGNQMGLFAIEAFVKGSTVTAEDCDFVDNSTDGGSHDTYLSGLDRFTSRRNHYYGSKAGNNSKSRRTAELVYEDDWNRSNVGRWIDAAEGAKITVTRGTYVGGTVSQNVFGNGEEGAFAVGDAVFDGVTMWLGRGSDFMATGVTTFRNLAVTGAQGAGAFNDRGPPMVGFPASIPAGDPPAAPPYVSGAH